MIVTIKNVKDRHLMEQYWANVTPTFADTGVKALAVYTPFKIVEGEEPIDGMFLAEFPDRETANRWYKSPSYEAIRHYRQDGAESAIIFLDSGISESPDDWMPHTKDRAKAF
ncbi:MAG: DUF1330 domain-containing protein [Acidobacteriales bacterium]|nr:DUF1330 domain-containing protein [Terriglobales bacterium]